MPEKNIGDFQIIFLFSLPRAGSTLLQRLLASHAKISTCSEPWLLLPFFYALRPDGASAEYNHLICYRAFQDLISKMPNQEQDYYEALNKFAKVIYGQLKDKNSTYFLDKTPRYYLIIPKIAEAFPDAKFIFLFRNPLHMLASIISTWNEGRLRLGNNYIDLYQGPRLLSEGYSQLKDKAIKINFETLVIDPNNTLKRISSYLELDFDESMLDSFNKIVLKGRMGDPSGISQYKSVDKEPLEKWREVLNTAYRKKFALKYLNNLGTDVLQSSGYDMDRLKELISRNKAKRNIGMKDRYDLFKDNFYRWLEIPMFKSILKKRLKK